MRRIVYVSAGSETACEDDVARILSTARRNNSAADITGMLLHMDFGFLQILEGGREAVQRTYARILRDPRHTMILKLVDEEITERLFGDWSMGFDRLTPDRAGMVDVFRISRDALAKKVPPENSAMIATLVGNFYRVNHPGALLKELLDNSRNGA